MESGIVEGEGEEKTLDCIQLPLKCSRTGFPPSECLAVVLDDILSEDECFQLIERGRPLFQYITKAADDFDGSVIELKNPRKYKLAVFQDQNISEMLWNRIRERVAPEVAAYSIREACGPPMGLNPRLRFLHYSEEDRFEPHFDRKVPDGDGKISLITVLVYLNTGGGEDFSGGETLFLNRPVEEDEEAPATFPEQIASVIPQLGRVVVFEHDLYHSGARLDHSLGPSGPKFVMRTDIMFSTESNFISNTTTKEGLRHATKITTVGELLEELALAHWREDLEAFGVCGNLDAFCSMGRPLACALLSDVGMGEEEIERFVSGAYGKVQ